MRSIAVLFLAVFAVFPAASCTAPLAVQPTIADWWANRRAALAGNRPEPPAGLYLSSWSSAGFTIAWWPAPTILPAPRADRWEVRIARGPWTPVDVNPVEGVPGGFMYVWIEGPPPQDGTLLSVRGVNAAGPGPASSLRIAIPRW